MFYFRIKILGIYLWPWQDLNVHGQFRAVHGHFFIRIVHGHFWGSRTLFSKNVHGHFWNSRALFWRFQGHLHIFVLIFTGTCKMFTDTFAKIFTGTFLRFTGKKKHWSGQQFPNAAIVPPPPGYQPRRQLILTDGGGWTGCENRKKSSILKISRILFDIFF